MWCQKYFYFTYKLTCQLFKVAASIHESRSRCLLITNGDRFCYNQEWFSLWYFCENIFKVLFSLTKEAKNIDTKAFNAKVMGRDLSFPNVTFFFF